MDVRRSHPTPNPLPRLTRLDSTAVVVSEEMPGRHSVAFGLYFPTGSRHETDVNNGISHFIEHLVFKGTARRTADEINREIDALGGAANAYTSKEVLCLHARVLSEHLPRIAEFFGDMAADALPPGVEEEVERERQVILSEISSVEDSPEELVGDLCDAAFFGDHPLALPVVGSARAVERLRLPEIRTHYHNHLVADGLVIAAAGQVDHDELVRLAQEHFAGIPLGTPRAVAPPPEPHPACRVLERDHEQVHVCMSARGISRRDPRYAVLDLLSTILGDGYSSRLFREVRDRRGLAYSIYSSPTSYLDSGSFNVYMGVSPERLGEAFAVVGDVLAEVRDGAVTEEELRAAKLHMRGSMVLSQEAAGARIGYIAEEALLGHEDIDFERELAAVEAVTLPQVCDLARELLDTPLALAAVGPVTEADLPGVHGAGWALPERGGRV